MQALRTTILGGGLLCAGGLLAWILAEAAPPPPLQEPSSPPADPPLALPGPDAPETASGAVSSAPAAPAGGRRDSEPTIGWTTGVVKGDVQLAVSVLDRIQSIRIEIEEARNRVPGTPPPFRRVVPLTMGRGTPTFEIRDIPFSAYPYVVAVVSPGLNGSRRTLAIDERSPLVDDVVLTITPGAPVTFLLRDQDAQPLCGIDVRALPVGEPAGRPAHQGLTDNFGSVVFLDVLAGDYEVTCSLGGQPLLPPRTFGVQPGVHHAYANLRGQGHTITIERGVPVHLLVSDGAGYPIVGARVTATATDRIRLTTRETTTDEVGRASFPHLQPGQWQFVVESDRHELWDRQRTLQPDQEPLHLEVRLHPRR
jgi:hypothetical protein